MAASEQVRTFVAVPVKVPALQRALVRAQDELRRVGERVRWVSPQQWHFTLKFLGEISPQEVEAAQAAVGRAVDGVAPFTVMLAGLGAFPHPDRPRVVWAGCGEGSRELTALAQRVDAELHAAGFPRERRPFSPHLTLGRVRPGDGGTELAAAIQAGRGRTFGTLPVETVVLYRSDLRPTGPVYTPLSTFPLG